MLGLYQHLAPQHGMRHWPGQTLGKVDDLKGLLPVQLARPAIVVDAESQVARLLHLVEDDPLAQGVYRTRRQKEHVPCATG